MTSALYRELQVGIPLRGSRCGKRQKPTIAWSILVAIVLNSSALSADFLGQLKWVARARARIQTDRGPQGLPFGAERLGEGVVIALAPACV